MVEGKVWLLTIFSMTTRTFPNITMHFLKQEHF